jgi:LSD1 subclass zinc finger protein
MPIQMTCPACKKLLQVPDSALGKQAKCPLCQHVLLISSPTTTGPATSSPVSASTAAETAGLWRDGSRLVAAIEGARFPRFCVKTGVPVSDSPTRVELSWLPNAILWVGLFGAIGHALASQHMAKKVSFNVPIASAWLSRRRTRRRVGWLVVALGLLWLIGGIVGYIFALMSGMPEASTRWLFPVIMLGPLISLAALLIVYLRLQTILTARKIDDSYAWITGVHPSFLERLPAWNRA